MTYFTQNDFIFDAYLNRNKQQRMTLECHIDSFLYRVSVKYEHTYGCETFSARSGQSWNLQLTLISSKFALMSCDNSFCSIRHSCNDHSVGYSESFCQTIAYIF